MLKVSPNKRFLMHDSGKPFFSLADTAWELLHRCDREEADLFLANRAQKRFTTIQAVALAELDGLNTPNQDQTGRDWILVLDDATKSFPAPGTI